MTHSIEWEGIAASISHTCNWLNTGFDHIEIRTAERLPITETGYKSHFIQPDELTLFASAIAFVEEWLEEAAHSPAWIRYREERRQLSLF